MKNINNCAAVGILAIMKIPNNIKYDDVILLEYTTIKIETTKNNIESIKPNHLVFFFATYISNIHKKAINNNHIHVLFIIFSILIFVI